MRNVLLIDIDDTLLYTNPRRRKLLLQPKVDWELFYQDSFTEDEVISCTLNLLRYAFSKDYKPVFITGRSDISRTKTLAQLRTTFEGVLPKGYRFSLFMRKAGDLRAASIVKRDLFYEGCYKLDQVSHIFEDDLSVIKMWQKEYKRHKVELPVFVLPIFNYEQDREPYYKYIKHFRL